ncbi:MAG TPA: hypothetical protein VNU70_01370 [Puia sp.]|jgi:hypothetical protein|nr:hypothetical protein [Puia sp.]
MRAMPKYLCLVAFLWSLLTTPAKAQEKAPHWSIGLAAGPAFPVGTFAGYHSPIQSSGGVSIGGNAELSGEYRLCPSFSVAMAFSGQVNHGAGVPYYLTQQHFSSSSGANTGFNSDWRIARILAGGVYSIPLSKRQGPALFFRLLAGIGKIRTPDYSYTVYPPSGFPSNITQPGASLSWTFSYETGAGIKWGLSPGVALLCYAGYSGSRPSKETPNIIITCPNGGCNLLPLPDGSFVTGTIQVRAGAQIAL